VKLAPDAQAAPEATATVRRLLVAYVDTLDVVDSLPVTPMVATGWHWWSRLSAPIRLPRASWMLRSLTLWHIDRVLAGAERAFHRRSALGIAGAGEADALDAVTEFRASLPSRSRALRIGVFGLTALVFARLLATLLPHHIRADTRIPTTSGYLHHALELWARWWSATIQLLDNTLGALTANSATSAVDTLFKASPAALAAAAVLLSASLYLILRPVASAFRLKRLLLNLYPQAGSMRSSTSASWSVSRSTGVYSIEQETFATLGARAPGVPPLDLLVSLPVPIIGVALLVGVLTGSGSVLAGLVFGLPFYGAPSAIRLAWLGAAWRARNGRPRSAWLFSDEISVPWRSKPVRCRSPVLIGWLSLFGPSGFVIIWWLWRLTSRDLRELGRAYDIPHLRKIHPQAQAFAAGPGAFLSEGLSALIVLFRAPRFVQDAQAAVGVDRPVTRHIAWLAPLWPVLCVLLQRELNRLWQVQGTPVDPHNPAIDLAQMLDAPR
jgi:hypothetical protein